MFSIKLAIYLRNKKLIELEKKVCPSETVSYRIARINSHCFAVDEVG